MSDQEHTPRGPASDPEKYGVEVPRPESVEVDEPHLVDPDTVQLSDAEVSPEAIEPELTVTPDDVELVEPSLSPAQISEDTARAASLEETADESRRVEQEALDAGQLVAGRASTADSTAAAMPAGTAPVGGAAGDTEKAAHPAAAATTDDENDDAANTRDAAPDTENDDAADVPNAAPDTKNDDAADMDLDVDVDADRDDSESARALPSFAAESDTPQWTAAATDEGRWDRMFHDADPESTVDAPSPVPAALAAGGDGAGTSATGAKATGDGAGTKGAGASAAAAAGTCAEGAAGHTARPSDSQADVPTTDPAGPAAPALATTADPAGPAVSHGSHPRSAEQPGEPAGGPYGLPPAGTQPTRRRDGRRAADKGPRNKGLLIGGALLGLLALGLLIWGLISLISALTSSPDTEPISSGTPGADGIIAENVLPIDLEAGQCLRDFVDINTESTVVTCSTPHNAQLLATEFYADGDDFPGEEALALRAQEVCDGVDLDEGAASRYENLELLRVTPQQNAWSDGDRRVDCLVTSSEGNIIGDTLIID